ncbi:MAG: hypothetical protein GKR94_12325 [Gammaproteobacteria bacterium]|nr:hypothetical protein [Gammaproteobacteria bacterium]
MVFTRNRWPVIVPLIVVVGNVVTADALLWPHSASADLNIGILLQQVQAREAEARNRAALIPDHTAVERAAPVDAQEQFRLAASYDAGQGIPRDYRLAAKWYRAAAEQGHIRAQTSLGLMYAQGHGVPPDDRQAAHWLRRAAEAGEPLAQYNLGLMYYEGRGVPREYSSALHWYRRSAMGGNAKAMNNLGIMAALGHGVEEDDAQAYAWFSAGAAFNNADAINNKELTAQNLSPEKLSRGEAAFNDLKAEFSLPWPK